MKGQKNRLSPACRVYLRFTRQLPACGSASQSPGREREGGGGYPESLVAGARWRETGSKVIQWGKGNRNGGGRAVRLREKLGSIRAIFRDKSRRCNLLGLWYIPIVSLCIRVSSSPVLLLSSPFFHAQQSPGFVSSILGVLS